MRTRYLLALAFSAAACGREAAPDGTASVAPDTVALPAPDAALSAPFSRVRTLREESSGRVLVLDDIEIRIARVDFDADSSVSLGRSGAGPGEYTYPLGLVGWRGDTTLAVDMAGARRSIVITASAVLPRPLRIEGIAESEEQPIWQSPYLQSDSLGVFYEPQVTGAPSPDGLPKVRRVAVRRIDRTRARVDTLVVFEDSTLVDPPAGSGPVAQAARRRTPVPFESTTQVAIAPDGRIAVLDAASYRIALWTAGGRLTARRTIPFDPVPVDEALKDAWREQQRQPVASLTFSSSGIQAGSRVLEFQEPESWPAALPAVPSARAVFFAPDGTLWVRRSTPADVGHSYDLVDRRALPRRHLVLPVGARLVGLGRAHAYVVHVDDDGLEFLKRHPLP